MGLIISKPVTSIFGVLLFSILNLKINYLVIDHFSTTKIHSNFYSISKAYSINLISFFNSLANTSAFAVRGVNTTTPS